jgi:hypothetical protein
MRPKPIKSVPTKQKNLQIIMSIFWNWHGLCFFKLANPPLTLWGKVTVTYRPKYTIKRPNDPADTISPTYDQHDIIRLAYHLALPTPFSN